MRAGKLRHRLEIQSQAQTQDSITGEVTGGWSTVATRWGSVEPLNGREYVQSQQVQAEVTHRITMRHFDGLTVQHRIKWGNRLFDINHVADFESRGIRHELMCRESV